jgi:hypothetical protein
MHRRTWLPNGDVYGSGGTVPSILNLGRLRLKCDGTRAETRFRLSAKRRSPFKSVRPSVQSTTGNRYLRISGSNAGNTPFASFPFISPPVRHRVPSHFNWTLLPKDVQSRTT